MEIILSEKLNAARKRKQLSPTEKAAAWLEGAKRFPHTPPLSDDVISRENLYGTRGYMSVLVDINVLLRMAQPDHECNLLQLK